MIHSTGRIIKCSICDLASQCKAVVDTHRQTDLNIGQGMPAHSLVVERLHPKKTYYFQEGDYQIMAN